MILVTNFTKKNSNFYLFVKSVTNIITDIRRKYKLKIHVLSHTFKNQATTDLKDTYILTAHYDNT